MSTPESREVSKSQNTFSNPFFAKTPVQGKTFFGREDVLKKLFYDINAGESVSLFGERRTGKTSILGEIRAIDDELDDENELCGTKPGYIL